MDERYSIEVSDEKVFINGDLSIEEMFDYLNFFDKKGYCYVSLEEGYGAICIMKGTLQEKEESRKEKEHQQQDFLYKEMFDCEKDRCIKYQKQVEDLEHLIKELMKESTDKTNELKEENYKQKKKKKIDEMLCDPVVNEILCNREVGLEKSE